MEIECRKWYEIIQISKRIFIKLIRISRCNGDLTWVGSIFSCSLSYFITGLSNSTVLYKNIFVGGWIALLLNQLTEELWTCTYLYYPCTAQSSPARSLLSVAVVHKAKRHDHHTATLHTILLMTLFHFTVYMPYPLVFTFRNVFGFLLSSDTVCFHLIHYFIRELLTYTS